MSEVMVLRMAPDASWVRVGLRPELAFRPHSPSQRLLARLLQERRDRPGHSVAADELARLAWPDVPVSIRRNRLKVTIGSLRDRGLRMFLLWRDGGYLFDREAVIEVHGIVRVTIAPAA